MARASPGAASGAAVVHSIAFAFLPPGKQQGIAQGVRSAAPSAQLFGPLSVADTGLDLLTI